MGLTRLLESFVHDLRHGIRLLRRNPGFTLVAIASLALGIGANSAIFGLFNAVRLRVLPVRDPQELAIVRIANVRGGCCSSNTEFSDLTYPVWERLRQRQQGFSGMLAWSAQRFNLAVGGEAQYANVLEVSGDYFPVLGVPPAAGRLISASDDRRGCGSPAAVLSHAFWQKRFGGDPLAIGKTLTLEARPFEIIGVTPPDFFGVNVGHSFDVAIPLCAEPLVQGEGSLIDRADGWWLAAMGRLKPGWTLERATAQLQSISPAIFAETIPAKFNGNLRKDYLGSQLAASAGESGFSNVRKQFSDPLVLLLGITGLVLTIACANLANLMIARAATREREIAVRFAVGASRGRLVRQLLAESLLVACAGAAAGAFVASDLGQFLISSIRSPGDGTFLSLHTDWRVVAFTAALAVLTCIGFGLAPALQAARTAPATAIRAGGRGASAARLGLRRMLVVSQVALSLVLVVGALLFVRSFRNLVSVDAGFQQEGILQANLDFNQLKLPEARRTPFLMDTLARFTAVPGVSAAAYVSIVPLSGSSWGRAIVVGHERHTGIKFANVTPGYFRTMETPLLAGRDFNSHDTLHSPPVALVNETFARKFLHGRSALGQTFAFDTLGGETSPQFEIVGIVKDTKYLDLKEDFLPLAFFDAEQDAHGDSGPSVLMRCGLPLQTVIPELKRSLRETNPAIGYEFFVFREEIRRTLGREQLMATLAGFFGVVAALLATIGLYGVISYMVNQRRNEIGIRLALGAGRKQVIAMVLREAGVLLGVGLAVGTVLALIAGRAAGSMLFGLKPRDPAAIGISIVALAVVAVAASYLPARRAASLDPMSALRED
jgi:predicted permease